MLAELERHKRGLRHTVLPVMCIMMYVGSSAAPARWTNKCGTSSTKRELHFPLRSS
jgi:hypothetical protein